MNTIGFEETLDYYANEINEIIDSFRIDKQNITLKRLEDFKKDIEDERDEMQKDRWESIEDGDDDDDDDDDDDWEEMGGICPELAPNHDWDSNPVGFR